MGNSNKKKDVFRFKHFSVIQGNVAMRVNTDGVLLGAFMADFILANNCFSNLYQSNNSSRSIKILDVGSGTGVISLMMAQALSQHLHKGIDNIKKEQREEILNQFSTLNIKHNYHIDAIDIDKECYEISSLNFHNSLWSNHLESQHTSLQEFVAENGSYDCILSNPPFFKNSLKSPKENKSVAKHYISLSFNELVSKSSQLLRDNGLFAVIIPADRKDEFLSIAERFFLYPKEILNIFSKASDMIDNKPPKRSIILLSKGIQELHINSAYLYTDDKSTRSDWYRSLTEDFYL